MTYTVKHANHPTTPPLTLSPTVAYPPGSPGNPTDLYLYGKGAPNYGQGHQENMLHLLENFAANTAPLNPVQGQLWFDTTLNTLKVWSEFPDGSAVFSWRAIGAEVRVAYVDEYNELVDIYNTIVGTPLTDSLVGGCSTMFGYGQVTLPNKTVITNQDWKDLIAKFEIIGYHIGNVTGTPNDFTFGKNNGFIMDESHPSTLGIASVVTKFNQTVQACNDLIDNRFNISVLSTETFNDPSGQKTRATPWASNITHEILLTFTDTAHAGRFFNSGGGITLTPGLTPPGSPGVDETRLVALFAEFVNVKMTGCTTTNQLGVPLGTSAKGYHDLTTTYQTLFERYSGGITTRGGYKVEARLEGAGEKNVRVLITFICPTGGDLIGGNVSGTLTSASTLQKANNLYINNPIITFPSVTSAGSM